jgi:leucyl aminopeptidase
MKFSFSEPGLPKTGAVIVCVGDGGKLSATARQLDKATGSALSRAIKESRFSGKKFQLLDVVAPGGVAYGLIVMAGVGKGLDEQDQLALGGRLYAHLNQVGVKAAQVALEVAGRDLPEAAANVAHGAHLRSYRFDKYRTQEKADAKPTLRTLTIRLKGAAAARRAYAPLEKIAEGVFFTRDLVSEPPNVLYPETFAKEVKALTKLGVKVEILGEKQMAKLGMGSLLGVGQGSVRESQIAIMRWDGAAKSQQPVAFIGKGVTFDTGGISLKPGPGMQDMKWDMGGAGTVSGLMKALAGRKAKVNAIGMIGLVENMPDGNAQRPGDIVTSMSGQTIEIHNTDAEGRLVLADVLWYAQERFKPQFMVDLATLTGAIIISLGHEHAGMFSNDDKLSEQLTKAGLATGEKVWRMPLGDAYDKKLNTDGADMKNVAGRDGGSITAAQFLQRFVNKVPWAHLDIAGMAWSNSVSPIVPRGGTGFGVRLLDRFVRENYEG